MTDPSPIPTHAIEAGAVRQISRAQTQPSVPQAIAHAAHQTSVDFDYLIAQAELESAMDPDAKAPTSSATGLYQFIESTWLSTMKRHGPRFGFGDVAAQISTTQSGAAYVADPGQRQAILALRSDPQIASLMAAGLAEDNRAHLTPILGRQPDKGELYLAHFLGAGGAGRFLSELAHNPNQNAANLFRRPAAANQAIFYQSNGTPRSLANVMNLLNGKMERALARAPEAPPALDTLGQMPYANGIYRPESFTPPPYVIAEEGVFGPRTPPVITGGTHTPDIAIRTRSLPSSANFDARPVSMSNLLRATFGEGETGLQSISSEEGAAQVRRAYDRLKALGL